MFRLPVVRRHVLTILPAIILLGVWVPSRVAAAESLSESLSVFQAGKYSEALLSSQAAVDGGTYGEEWPVLRIQCELVLGKYAAAMQSSLTATEKYPWSVRLHWLKHQCCLANGRYAEAVESLREIERLAIESPWRYADADDLVVLGEVALKQRIDPKDVLEGFFDRARISHENVPDGYLAGGRLAHRLGDDRLAAELLRNAVRRFPENAEVHLALSDALDSGDRQAAVRMLEKSLELNPNLPQALQKVAEFGIDAEEWSAASETIQKLLAINPDSPEAHSLNAVIAILQSRQDDAETSRSAALKFSPQNPVVDHLIGKRLSLRYRFAEGAAFQRRAIASDPEFVPARLQLARDLLRLGSDAEGWQLIEDTRRADEYNVGLYNLQQLKKTLDQFVTIKSEHFEIRMDRHEAAVYGSRVRNLLTEAQRVLSEKYQLVPKAPVIVEIFPRADDFAVRTFEMPDVSGFLGVCFGHLITMNSPSSRRGREANWESVLWHEYCHVVTLQMTENRIPRWLSEGISVYEERQRDPRCGSRMTAAFRDRILSGRTTPISELSSAFLTSKSSDDVHFAYFESSLVVEQIVEVFGMEVLRALLQDLQKGVQINDALERHTGAPDHLEESFQKFLKARAEAFASAADLSDLPDTLDQSTAELQDLESFLVQHPNHVRGLQSLSRRLIGQRNPAAAAEKLRRVCELMPDDGGPMEVQQQLAQVFRELNLHDEEMKVLKEITERSVDLLEPALRLQQLSAERDLAEDVVRLGNEIAGIDPFQIDAAERTFAAAETIASLDTAATIIESLVALQPDQAADLYFRMARLEAESKPSESRRHLIQSLSLAPRNRAAHKLLLELTRRPAE
jgi:tetratricopeptide (TPR) repeat protein